MKKIFTSSPLSLDFGLLLLRVLLAAGLLTHGIAKIANFSALSTSFLDPLGIGVLPALLGAIFAEVVCSILVLIGLWTRLTVLPLIFTPKAASLRRRICRQMILRFKSFCAGESLPTLFFKQ